MRPEEIGAETTESDFASLESWQRNDHLAKAGTVTPRPAEKAVTLTSPVIDPDGSLLKEIATDGHPWFAWAVRTKGGTLMRASPGLVGLDGAGRGPGAASRPAWWCTTERVIDLVSGTAVTSSGNGCPIQIEPGAFRILPIELSD